MRSWTWKNACLTVLVNENLQLFLRRSRNDAVESGLGQCYSACKLQLFLALFLVLEKLHLSCLITSSDQFTRFYQNLYTRTNEEGIYCVRKAATGCYCQCDGDYNTYIFSIGLDACACDNFTICFCLDNGHELLSR